MPTLLRHKFFNKLSVNVKGIAGHIRGHFDKINLSGTFIYESILTKKKYVNDNFMKTHFFSHKMKYDLRGQ